jgi:hypothetical protein
MLLALLGTLGAIAGIYIMYTKIISLLESEDALATGLATTGSASGLTLILVSLIAMYLSMEPKEKDPKKKRIDTH